MPPPSDIYEPSEEGTALRQCEILSGIIQHILELAIYDGDEPQINPKSHPHAIVLSQDCDLDWDFKARTGEAEDHKLLPNIILCEVHLAEEVRGRGHNQGVNSAAWDLAATNRHEQFHFLQLIKRSEDLRREGLPEFTIDFKRYFSLPTEELYKQLEKAAHRRTQIKSPYKEHLSSRYSQYQSRVALPEPHFSEPAN